MCPDGLSLAGRKAPHEIQKSNVRIRLLGLFQLSVGDRVIEESEWRLRKASQIVKLLALAPNRTLHRDQLIEILWPDQDRQSGNRNLRYALHIARRVFGQLPLPEKPTDYLQLQHERLTLCPMAAPWIDVNAFEQAASLARQTPEPELIQAAIDLYDGDLLPADRYEDWATGPRDHMRETYLEMLLALAGCHVASGALSNAITTLQHIVALEPVHEEAHTCLMRLYARSGQRLQALRQFQQLSSALRDELDTEPEPDSRSLYSEIQAGRLAGVNPERARDERPSLGTRPTNLPIPLTSFVGRRRELARIQELLSSARLVTLAGPGGCGKTRLATELGRTLVGTVPDGVWFVDFSPLIDPGLVFTAVASSLGIPEVGEVALTTSIAASLQSRDLVLILDNCEHLAEQCAQVAICLLGACPRLRILATSREPLHVEGEAVWRVAPLDVPDSEQALSLERLGRNEAIRLFIERANLVQPNFTVTLKEMRTVLEICRRLEGLPLAIELAAARLASLPLEQLLLRIDDALRLLASPSRSLALRQRTMQAALDWSFELLTEQERAIWPRLAVFAGTWSLEAAEAVASDDGIAACDVFDLVSRLVDKSLVAVDLSAGEARYRLLEVLRQYAWQRLDERHEVEPVRQRHAGYYLMFAEAVEPELRGSNQVRWLERLEQEHDNLRAALRWLVERDDAHDSLRLAGALAHFWWVRDHYQEGRGWLSKVIERADGLPPCAASVKALTGLFMIAFRQGDLATASASAEERLTLARRLGDGQATAWSLTHLAWIAGIRGDRASEVALLDEALSLFRDLGDTTGIAAALNALGESARMCRDDQRAVALYEESLAHYEDMDNRLYILTVSHNLAWSLQRLGYISRAAELFRDSLIQSREFDSKTGISISLTGLAGIAAGSGEAALAARLLGAAEALRYSVGAVADEVDLAEFHRAVGAARERVGEQPFEASWKAGSEAPLDDTIDRALAITFADDRLITETGAAYPLSPRELEIARLIAAGSTNARIAAALGISPRTVDKHASNILHKLGLASRHQIAGWLAPHDDPPIGQTDTHT